MNRTAATFQRRLPLGQSDRDEVWTHLRETTLNASLALFRQWGYTRVDTPLYECADVLRRGLADTDHEPMIQFVEPLGGEVVALRPDFTPQIARQAAGRLAQGVRTMRVCYAGPVLRQDPGRQERERWHAGVEWITADAHTQNKADAETVALAATLVRRLARGRAVLEVGSVAFVRTLFESLPPPARLELQGILHRQDIDALWSFEKGARLPLHLRRLLAVMKQGAGSPRDVHRVVRLAKVPAALVVEMDALLRLAESARDILDGAAEVTVDLTDIRGIRYYSGMRLRGFLAGASQAVVRGGRYDGLVEKYGTPAFAVGLGIDVDAMVSVTTKEMR